MQNFKSFLAITISYFLVAQGGLALTSINHNASPIWPATGVAIALLYYFGTRYWSGIFAGAFLANVVTGIPFYSAALMGIGNTLEAFAAVIIIVAVKNWREREHEKDGEILGIVSSSFIAAAISATIGTLALVMGKSISIDQAEVNWITWWSGDVVGGIVAFPVTMFALRNSFRRSAGQAGRLIGVVLVAFIIGLFVFGYKSGEPFAFLVFLGLLLALYISGEMGLYFYFVVVSIASIIYTLHGYGPFVMGQTNDSLMALQLFLGSFGLTTFVLAEFHKFLPLKYLARPLIIGWLISGAIFHSYYQQHLIRDQMRLKSLAREYTSNIENQFQLHRRALRASSGLFTASDKVTREEWRTFTNTLDIKLRFRGMLGIGYIRAMRKSEVPAYEREQRRTFPEFTVKNVAALTEGSSFVNSDLSFIIQYLEPVEDLRSAIGLDVATELFRYEAATISRDTGQTALTQNVSLKINKNKGSGFLLFVPIYKANMPIKTIEERRAAHKGWMYAPLLVQDLIVAATTSNKPELDYEIYLKKDENRKLLLATSNGYFSNNPRYNMLSNEVTISKQKFIIQWKPNATFISSRDFTLAWVGAMGVLLALATAWMLMSSQSFIARAEEIVEKQTKVISEQNHLWQALMESAPVGVLHVDINGAWQYVNSKWYNLFRARSRNEFTENSMKRIHPEDQKKFLKKWNLYLENKDTFEVDFRIIDDDNTVTWLQTITTKVLNDEGKIIGHVCVAIDLTQQTEQLHLLEKERAKLVESAKMASLGEMAGSIAHEINNPLMIILQRIEQLKRVPHGQLTEDFIHEQTNKIEKTAERIAKIVKGLRAFSRNSDNDQLAQHSIKTIVDDTLSLCGEKLKQNNISLEVIGLKDWHVMCRPSELSQVLLNLITNAFDAISQQKSPWIRIETFVNNNNLFVRVTDSGPGLPSAIAEKIMTPFFTTKPVGKGTGLGLSISRSIIEVHGGSLRVDRASKNTSFIIELPLKV